jgi:GT2 family glycosyltransferase
LQSLLKSVVQFDFEIIVVDNNSVDGSVAMLENYYKDKIKLIINKDNLGFSKANNMGIKVSEGAYILLLNPDTLVMEDTLQKMVDFMEINTNAGAVGVKMLDGEGKFLPESKRGFPTPKVALYKMLGLSKIFSKSKKFGQYHLGFLSKEETHEVDVLSGACMMIRRNVLEQVGLLDEDYFMYGEDIDLSYQINKAGYKNYYFPETNIIHFKGESTKKGSLNYVKMFYQAMLIFFDKNLSHDKNKFLISLIKGGIYLKAFAAGVFRVSKSITLPIADALFIFTGLLVIKEFWAKFIKASENITYFPEYFLANFSLYTIIWLTSVYLSGGYDYPLKKRNVVTGVLWGSLLIAAIYGFLPLEYRFSRGMIVVGTGWSIIVLLILRWFKYILMGENSRFWHNEEKYIVVGNESAVLKINDFFDKIGIKRNFIGFVFSENCKSDKYLGKNSQMAEIVRIHQPDEVIFASGEIEYQEIIQMMSQLNGKVKFKIAPEGMDSIIGSHSKNTAGDFYTLEIGFNLAQPNHRRKKRILDIGCFLVFFVLSPFLFLFQKNKSFFYKNIFQVLFGNKTWVGYQSPVSGNLPKIKPGVIAVQYNLNEVNTQESYWVENLNLTYAKEYSILNDVIFLFSNLNRLGG